MKITERRIVVQEWFEDSDSKNGWSSGGWEFLDDKQDMELTKFEVVNILDSDKYYNPILGIAEKETDINY